MRFAQWALAAAFATTVALTGLGAGSVQAGGSKTVYVDHKGVPNPLDRAATCGKPNYKTIQAAVNDPTANRIIVCPGTYTEQVTVARSVILEGKSSPVIQSPKAIANPGMIVAFTGPQQSDIHGFVVTGANNLDTNLYAGIGVQNGATVKIFHNHITDIDAKVPGYNDGYGIYVDAGKVTIVNNSIEKYGNTGIEANAGGVPNTVAADITHNTVKGHLVSAQSNGQSGIDLREEATGTIQQNTVTGNQTPFDDNGFCILVDGTVGVSVKNNKVSGNQTGIEVSESNQAIVSGNTATKSTGNGIELHKTFDSLVSNNTSTGNNGSGIALTGNKYDPTTNVIVDSNNVSANDVDGIFIDKLMVTNKITTNTIKTSSHLDIEDLNGTPLQNSYMANTCTTSNPNGLCN